MKHHYFLWAFGRDHPGIVAEVTRQLFRNGCNIEDSTMMRLGGEFGIFLIFSSKKYLSNPAQLSLDLKSRARVVAGVKEIPDREARFVPAAREMATVVVHGMDKPGIVYRVTAHLAQRGFNITDLATHRTTAGKVPGYILIVEGELGKGQGVAGLRSGLARLAKTLRVKIDLNRTAATPV